MTDQLRSRRPGAATYVSLASLGALAVLAYVPLLLTSPGSVAADTKAYLYLDPGRLMSSALSMWDPSVAGGMVTHQNIGYLLPQGPFYWLGSQLGLPVWVTQRLWAGTLLFAAGSGVWFLARVSGLGGTGRLGGAGRLRSNRGNGDGGSRVASDLLLHAAPFVAGSVYMLSPYFLQYVQRISAILMPWAGLGWMLAFTILAVRRGGWRFPALFGIVVAIVGGTNATSLLYAGIAPLLWIPFAVLVAGEATWRRAIGAAGRIVVVTFAVSLWWMAGLAVEGAYGLSILQYTETLPAIASTSVPSEVLRGLGYWYFYGGDRLGPWLTASVEYEQKVSLILTSFALPVMAFLGAAVARWRARTYYVLLLVVGLVLSVGTNPYADPSLFGRALKSFMTGTTAGLALRSSDRATPLVVLGVAVLGGAGVAAVASLATGRVRSPARRRVGIVAGGSAAALATALAVVNATPFLTGAAVQSKYSRPEQIPSYMTAAASYLDAKGSSTRVLFEPGENYGVYDWGATLDPVWPGLLTRPSIQRQQLIDGTVPTADLLQAFDLSLQEGTYDPATLAPIARLLSAGDVVLQSNLAYWWFQTPGPQETWPLFDPPPLGVGSPVQFGPPSGDTAPAPYSQPSDALLALPPGSPVPPALAVFPISGARPIYRAEPAGSPVIVDGAGNGILAAAASGLLDENPTILYAGTLDTDPALRSQALQPGAQLVLTDSNGKVERSWTTVQDNVGELLPSYPIPTAPDPAAAPLVMFPGAPADAQTTALYSGAAYVTASGYGNPIDFITESRPALAFDGNPSTAWTVGAITSPVGSWIEIGLRSPVTADHVDLVQALDGAPRIVTRVTLTFDGGSPLTVRLGPSSLTRAGQTVSFTRRSFSTLRITIDGTNDTPALNGVGFAEIRIPGVHVTEGVQLPSDMLRSIGTASLSHRLTILLTRNRVGAGTGRADPESFMNRSFWLPTARTFTLAGTAHLSDIISDAEIDRLLGGSAALAGVTVTSNDRLPGDAQARALFAFDGNPATAWQTAPGGGVRSAWVQVTMKRSISFDHIDLTVMADGRHTIPTALRITSDTGGDVLVHLPPIADAPVAGRTVTVPLSFTSLSGTRFRFAIAGVGAGAASGAPIGIAEMGVPGLQLTPENPTAPLPDVCTPTMLQIDGVRVDVRIVGTVGQAETGQGLAVAGCGNSAGGILLSAGTHRLVTTNGALTGFALDRLALDSAPGGGAMPLAPGGGLQPAPGTMGGSPGGGTTPAVRVLSSTPTSATLAVSGASGPFWLVLGQGQNQGWSAGIDGGPSLGTSVLVDGYANGWYIAHPPGGRFTVTLSFTPQGEVTAAIALSGLALAGCPLIAVWPRRRRALHGSRPGAEVEAPVLGNPLFFGGAGPAPAALGAAALLSALAAWAVVTPPYGPLAAVVVGGAVLAGGLAARARLLTALPALGLAVATGILVAARQVGERIPAGGGWPSNFRVAGVLAWLAVLMLGADALVEILREASRGGRHRRRTSAARDPEGEEAVRSDGEAAVGAPEGSPGSDGLGSGGLGGAGS